MKVKELIAELEKLDPNKRVGQMYGYYDSHGGFVETCENIGLSDHYDMDREEWFVWIG